MHNRCVIHLGFIMKSAAGAGYVVCVVRRHIIVSENIPELMYREPLIPAEELVGVLLGSSAMN